MIGSTARDRAAASKGPRKYVPPPGAVSGLNMIPTRLMRGVTSLSISNHLPPMAGLDIEDPVDVPTGRGESRHESCADRIGNNHEHYRDRAGFTLQRRGNRSSARQNHIGPKFDQLFRKGPHPVDIATGPTNI